MRYTKFAHVPPHICCELPAHALLHPVEEPYLSYVVPQKHWLAACVPAYGEPCKITAMMSQVDDEVIWDELG